jgi:hypothetical protein
VRALSVFNKSYLDQASEFFATTDLEIDPDAALFFCFHQDSAFWLWIGGHLQSLVSQAAMGGEGNDSRPRIDRFLHGMIACDQFLGRQGTVIKAMVGVLGHTPSSAVGVLTAPELNLLKNLKDTGPYSDFTSTRLVHYAQSVLSPVDYAAFTRTFAAGDEYQSMLLSASLANHRNLDSLLSPSATLKKTALYLTILNAVNQASLVTEHQVLITSLFPTEVVKVFCGDEGLTWAEWQLLPLLKGGQELAVSLGIDLKQVALDAPLGRPENMVRHLMINTYHVANSEGLQSYLEHNVMPNLEPGGVIASIIAKGPYGITPAIEPWIRNYVNDHEDAFHDADIQPKMLEAFLRMGVDKVLVMKHPQFNKQMKGDFLSDQLGL